MKLPKLSPSFEKLLHNWPAKIICLALALVLYFFYQVISLDRKNVSARLSVQTDGLMLPASSYDSFIRVIFRGSKENLAVITENEFEVFLDLTWYTREGQYNVPVKIRLSPALMKLDPLEIHLVPDTIPLKIENREYAEIPLKAMLQGEAAHGYQTAGVTCTPSTVRVSGPRSLVRGLQSLPTGDIPLDGRRVSFSMPVKVLNESEFIRLEWEEPVTATVTIAEKQETRRVSLALELRDLLPDFAVPEELPPVELEISAPQLIMDRLDLSLCGAAVDCSGITAEGSYELPVFVTLPYGFTLKSQTPESLAFTAVSRETAVSEAEGAEE
ncbi:MAG: hypothetical protein LBS97_01045 [Treponema sp.]|jgi:YbbR domain-containing protein|nr:hypothetical protein [Treponema sp.]